MAKKNRPGVHIGSIYILPIPLFFVVHKSKGERDGRGAHGSVWEVRKGFLGGEGVGREAIGVGERDGRVVSEIFLIWYLWAL